MTTSHSLPQRAMRLTAWLAASLVAVFYLVQSLRVESDIGRFIAVGRSAPGHALNLMQQGPAGRLVIIAISGGPPTTLATASRTLIERLASTNQFAAIHNGDINRLRRDIEPLFPYRYLLSGRWVESRFDAAYLHRQMTEAVPLLHGGAGWLVAELLPADPTLESLELARQWSTGTGLSTVDGAWLSADRSHAILLAVSRAEGNDADGQRALVDTINSATTALSTGTHERLTVEVSGLGILSAKAREATRQRVDRLGWISATAVLLILVIGYRRLLPIAMTALPALIGIAAGLAITVAVFGSINLLSLAFASILLGEAVDYPCYLLTQARSGESLDHEARVVWPTLRLAVATSVASLAVLLLADFEGLKQLGLLCSVALLVAGGATRWLLPDLVGPNHRVDWKPPVIVQAVEQVPLDTPRERTTPLRTAARSLRFIVPLVALAMLALAAPLWDDRGSAINPLPIEDIAKDQRLRKLAGIARTPSFLIMRSDQPQRILEAQEAMAGNLRTVDAAMITTGRVDFAARYVPSDATQAHRRAALPERGALERAVGSAVEATPFNAAAFAPFLDAIDDSRRLSLNVAALPSPALSLRAETLLFRADDEWVGLVSVADEAARAAVSAAMDRTPAAREIGGEWVEPAQTLSEVIQHARRRLVILLGVAIVVTFGVIAVAYRAPGPALSVLMPVAAALAISAAVVHGAFGPLTVFNLLSLLLVLGIATNYSLFLHRAPSDRSATRDRQTMFSLAMTSSTTLAVFGALAASGIPVVASIGRTVVIGIAVSLAWLLFDRRAVRR